LGLIGDTTSERQDPPKPPWRPDVRRRLNLKVHQQRSPTAPFTLYFCECDRLECDLKVALTDAEFAQVAGRGRSYIVHPRCPTAGGRGRRWWRRRHAG